MSGKNASLTRGRPLAKGNTGPPEGSRDKVTVVVEKLLDGDAEHLNRKAIELTMEGDTTALGLCLEPQTPPRKDSLRASLYLISINQQLRLKQFIQSLRL